MPSLSVDLANKHRVGARASGLRSLPRHDILEGSIDDLNRPLVRIELPGFTDPLVAFIDTGFNGAVLIDEPQANKLGFQIFKQQAQVRLASQREEIFLLGRGQIAWFGESKSITAYVLIETQGERRARIARKTEEEILIGTELLSDCRLEIDFPARRVLIAKVDSD
jgi:predicted aspartyl protease